MLLQRFLSFLAFSGTCAISPKAYEIGTGKPAES